MPAVSCCLRQRQRRSHQAPHCQTDPTLGQRKDYLLPIDPELERNRHPTLQVEPVGMLQGGGQGACESGLLEMDVELRSLNSVTSCDKMISVI